VLAWCESDQSDDREQELHRHSTLNRSHVLLIYQVLINTALVRALRTK